MAPFLPWYYPPVIEIKEIKLADVQAEASKDLSNRFKSMAPKILRAYELRGSAQSGQTPLPDLTKAVGEFLNAFTKLDEEYGETGAILLEDTSELADYCLRCLAELRNWLDRLELTTLAPDVDKLIIGAGLWAMRHECEVTTPEPMVNALAFMANDATSKQELAAVFGLMQGLIHSTPEAIKNDLEKSNPNRPWRVLLLNFAIVSVRTQDPPMMLHAFETLQKRLPEECAGFFAEAVRQAEHSAFSDEVRGLLQAEQAKWMVKH
ncbi:MAG TPA: hypothetical protein VM532_16690 [Burkholderiales bacterium]|nr:hypothetical protein [Burkholderiales bacterium]